MCHGLSQKQVVHFTCVFSCVLKYTYFKAVCFANNLLVTSPVFSIGNVFGSFHLPMIGANVEDFTMNFVLRALFP